MTSVFALLVSALLVTPVTPVGLVAVPMETAHCVAPQKAYALVVMLPATAAPAELPGTETASELSITAYASVTSVMVIPFDAFTATSVS